MKMNIWSSLFLIFNLIKSTISKVWSWLMSYKPLLTSSDVSEIIEEHLYQERKQNFMKKQTISIVNKTWSKNIQPSKEIANVVKSESPKMCNVSLGNTIEKIKFPDFPDVKDKMMNKDNISVVSSSTVCSTKGKRTLK